MHYCAWWGHCLQLELLRDLDTLRQRPDPSVDGVPFGLQPLELGPQLGQRHGEDLDELVFLQLGLEVLVLGEAHVDCDVHHAEVRVAEARV